MVQPDDGEGMTAAELPPAPALDFNSAKGARSGGRRPTGAAPALNGRDPEGLSWGTSRPRSQVNNNDARPDGAGLGPMDAAAGGALDHTQLGLDHEDMSQQVVLDPIPLYEHAHAQHTMAAVPGEGHGMDPTTAAAAAAAVAEAQAAAIQAMQSVGDALPTHDQLQAAAAAAQQQQHHEHHQQQQHLTAEQLAAAAGLPMSSAALAGASLASIQHIIALTPQQVQQFQEQQGLTLKPAGQIEMPSFTAVAPRQLKQYTGKKPVLSTRQQDGFTIFERDTVVTEAHCHLPLPKKFVREHFPSVIEQGGAFPVTLMIVDDNVLQPGTVPGSIRPQSRKMAISPGIDVLAVHRGWKFCGVSVDPVDKQLVRLYFDSSCADKYETNVGRKWARKYVEKAGLGGTGQPGNAAAVAAAQAAAAAAAIGNQHMADQLAAAAAAAAMQQEGLMAAGMAMEGPPAAPVRARRGRQARVSHAELDMSDDEAARQQQRVPMKRHGLAQDGAALADVEAAMAVSDAVDPNSLTMYPMQQGTYKAELRLPMQLVYQQLADLEWDGPPRNVYAVVHEEGSMKAATAFPGYVKKYQNRRKARLMLGYTEFMNLYKGWVVEAVGMVGGHIVRLHMHRPKQGELTGAPSDGDGMMEMVDGDGDMYAGDGVHNTRKRGRGGRGPVKAAPQQADMAQAGGMPGLLHAGDLSITDLAAAGQVRYLVAHPGGEGEQQWYAAAPQLLAGGPGQEGVWQLQLLPIQPGQEGHGGQQQLVLQAIAPQDAGQVAGAEGDDGDPNKRQRMDGYAPLTIAALQPGQHVVDEHGQPVILWQQPLQEGVGADGQVQAGAAGQLLQGVDLQGLYQGAPMLLQQDGSRTWAGMLRDATNEAVAVGNEEAAAAAAAAAAAGGVVGMPGADGSAAAGGDEAAAAAAAAAGSAPLDANALAGAQQAVLAYLPNGQLTTLRQLPSGDWMDAWGRTILAQDLVRTEGDGSAAPAVDALGAQAHWDASGLQMAQLAALQGQAGAVDLSQLQLQMGADGQLQLLHTAPGAEHDPAAAAGVAVSHGLLADPHTGVALHAGMADAHQVMAASAGMSVAAAGGELLGMELHAAAAEQEAAAHAAAAAAHGMTTEQWHVAYAAAMQQQQHEQQQQQQQQQHHELTVGDLSALNAAAAAAGGHGELTGVVGDPGAAAAAVSGLEAAEGGSAMGAAAAEGAAPVPAAASGEEVAAAAAELHAMDGMEQLGGEVQDDQ